MQDVPIGNLAGHTIQDQLVGDAIKEPMQVRIHHHPKSLPVQLDELCPGCVTTAMPPKAMRAVMKGRFTDRGQQSTEHFLSDPTPYGGNAKGADGTVSLGDRHPSQRDRLVGPRLQFAHKRHEVRVQVGFAHRERLCIESGRPAIALDGLKGRVERLEGDPAGERMLAVCVREHLEQTSDPP